MSALTDAINAGKSGKTVKTANTAAEKPAAVKPSSTSNGSSPLQMAISAGRNGQKMPSIPQTPAAPAAPVSVRTDYAPTRTAINQRITTLENDANKIRPTVDFDPLDPDSINVLQAQQSGKLQEADYLKKLLRQSDTSHEDTFLGQSKANYTVGRLNQDSSKAWSKYLDHPTEENKQKAHMIDATLQEFQQKNQAALDDEGAVLPILSRSAAGYIPQLIDQTKAQAQGALYGGTAGSIIPVIGTATGIKAGITAASGIESYQTMRGAAFKRLVELGADEDTARALANDEGFVSSLIEMGDTAVDIATLGGGTLISMLTGEGGRKLATEAGKKAAGGLLGKVLGFGGNVAGEGGQEFLQEGVSIANDKRVQTGERGKWNLVKGTVGTIKDAFLGGTPEDAANLRQMWEADKEGMKIAALMGGGQALMNYTGQHVLGRNMQPSPTVQDNDVKSVPSANVETTIDAVEGNNTTQAQNAAQRITDSLSAREAQDILARQQADQEQMQGPGAANREFHGEILETVRAHLDSVQGMDAVAELNGTEFQKTANDNRSLRAKVIEFFNSIGNKVTRSDIGDIELNPAGARDSTAHGYGKLKAATFAALPNVLQSGKIIQRNGPYAGHNYDSIFISAPVKVNGTTCYVGALVIKDDKTQRYKLHEVLTTNENGVPLFKSESGTEAGPLRSDTPSEMSGDISENNIPQTSAEVNTENDGLGAADAGFTTPGMNGEEKTSRMAESFPYNKQQEAATAMTKEDYDKLFRYQTLTEKKSLALAEEMLWFEKDGQRTFLKDIDDGAFQELVKSLDEATAWNAPQMDAAHIIQQELQGRSVNGEITSEEYTHFLQIMKDHSVSTAQGEQAQAKWSRSDNTGGSSTELEAWENLQKSKMTDEEKQAAFRKIVKWDTEIEAVPAGDTQSLKDIILNVARERGVLNGIFGNSSRLLESIASKSLDTLDFDQLKQFAYSSTSAYSTDNTQVSFGRKLKTLQVLNMLSSPKTAAKNITGNTSFYGLDTLAMDGAALLDMALSNITGTRSVAFEQSPLGKSSREAAIHAMQMSIAEITLDVDMGGEQTRYGTGSSRTFKANGNFMERVMSSLERNQGYLLNATDEFYKGAARSTAERTQTLIDQGKIKTENENYATEQADQLAKYRTFQDGSKISVFIQQMHDLFNMIGVGDSGKEISGQTVHAFGLGDIVAPFTKVAGNLASRGLEYSPVNAVRGTLEIVNAVQQAVRGETVDPSYQAKAVSNTARGLTGTAIAFGFMLLAKTGLLRKADDEGDENIRALNQSEGMTGTQLNVTAVERALKGLGVGWKSGDKLVDLSSIEPLNLLMDLGTEMAKDDANFLKTAGRASMDSFVSSTADLPVMQFVGNSATDIIRYHQDPTEVLAREAGKTVVSSLIPNVVRAAAKGLDDRPRSTYSGDTLVEVIRDTAKSGIPGLRETLPGSVNPFGEEKTYQGNTADRLVQAMLSPVGINHYTQNDVSKALQDLREETGDASFYPSKKIPSSLSYTDKKGVSHSISMDYEQRQDFQRSRGTQILISMADMMGNSAYKKASPEQQADLMKDVRSYAYDIAKSKVLGTDCLSKWEQETLKAQKSAKLSPSTVLVYRDKMSRLPDSMNTSAKNDAMRNAIRYDSSLTVAQKNALDRILISDGIYLPKDKDVDYTSDETFIISQMSDGAQKRWDGIKEQFGIDADAYAACWKIYQADGVSADEKKAQLQEYVGSNAAALYKALGKKLS